MVDGPRMQARETRRFAWQWAAILVLSAALLVRAVVDWTKGGPEFYPGQHTTSVLLPLIFLAVAGTALVRQGSTPSALFRAVAWGSVLALGVLELLGR